MKNEYIVIKRSKTHGRGGFARKDIKKGTRIIEYVGKKVSKKEAEKISNFQEELSKINKDIGAVYLFELNKKYDIDGNVPWNLARYINHSCEPNCEIEISKGRIWIIAKRDIKKGEELSYDYGYDLKYYQDSICKCGSKKCVGYIVAEKHRKKLKEILKKSGKLNKKDKIGL